MLTRIGTINHTCKTLLHMQQSLASLSNGSWLRRASKLWTRIGAMNRWKSPSIALRAPSPPLGEKDGMRGLGSWQDSNSLRTCSQPTNPGGVRSRAPRLTGRSTLPGSVAAKLVAAGTKLLAVFFLLCGSPPSSGAALKWRAGDGYRFAEVRPEGSGQIGFSRIPSIQSGLAFTNQLSDQANLGNRVLENGSGVATGDFDGDGLCDLYFCRLGGPNALFRNLGGWHFENVTRAASVACDGQFSTGAVFADIDGNGRLDLLVSSVGNGTRCFINLGGGKFAERPDNGLSRTNGSMSLALADVDRDGDLDVYIANYRAQTVKDSAADYSRLKLVDGRWQLPPDLAVRFESALDATGRPTLHEKGEPDVLYLNDGTGRFSAVSWVDGHFLDEAGRPLKSPPSDWSLSAMFRDINGDQLPDLYVCSDFIQPDRFWINQGHGHFRAIPRSTLTKTSRLSMSIDFGDLNRDGYDDFFVVDMLSPDRALRMRQRANLTPAMWSDYASQQRPQFMRNTLFMNRGNGTFAEIAQLAGLPATDWSWSTIFLDVDLDGYEDILIANGAPRDAQDVDAQNELERRPSFPVQHRNAWRLALPPLHTPNYLFRNLGNFQFEEAGKRWGFASTNISIGMALADLDNDGDLDVAINTLNSECEIYRNDAPGSRIGVRLKGTGGNHHGIGARIRLHSVGLVQEQEMISGGRYLSGDDSIRTFAANSGQSPSENSTFGSTGYQPVPSGDSPDGRASGSAANLDALFPAATSPVPVGGSPTGAVESPAPPIFQTGDQTKLELEVIWPSGTRSRMAGVQPNRIYEVFEPGPPLSNMTSNAPSEMNSLFEDASALLKHRHRESDFDDGALQPLLARQFSRMGPGLLVFDLDGDGWEDLIIGNGAGTPPDVFMNRRGERFERLELEWPKALFAGDQTTWLGFQTSDGAVELLCGLSNYEDSKASTNAVLRFHFADHKLALLEPIRGWGDSVGPLCLADIDRDGEPDLFVGGRIKPGRFPEPAASKLFRRKDGRFIEDDNNSRLFATVGLASGAVFSDLDGDGWPDLLLACEWGPLRVFLNRLGQFVEATGKLGLSEFTGWWNSVATGDFNNDGRPDIVAGNWGRNTKYQSYLGHRIGIGFGELQKELPFFQAETYFEPNLQKEVPWWDRDSLAQLLPSIPARFTTHADFGRAGIREILGEHFTTLKRLEAASLDSMVFLNRGGHFEAVALPLEVQISPCFGISVADFDGDGNEDLFLNQNFSGTELETSPHNDGVGVLLKGDGQGDFTTMRPRDSGIMLSGDGRGSVTIDWNHDGRPDLIATQNNQVTRLLMNRSGRPGLRVAFESNGAGPSPLGAALRWTDGSSQGPLREVQAGSGYWSQSGTAQILAIPKHSGRLWVRRSDGTTRELPIPTAGNEMFIR
jgi:hypothetical protein